MGMSLRLSASILFLAVLTGHAQSTARTGDDWAAISPDSVRFVLKRLGFAFTEKSSDDSIAYAFQLNGHPVTLLNQVRSIQLSSCFADGVAPIKQNQWNREH